MSFNVVLTVSFWGSEHFYLRVGEETTRVSLHKNKLLWVTLEVNLTLQWTLLFNVYNLSEYFKDWNLQGLSWQLSHFINLHECTSFYFALSLYLRKWRRITPKYAGFLIESHWNEYSKVPWNVEIVSVHFRALSDNVKYKCLCLWKEDIKCPSPLHITAGP